jgi:hypothetical protein
MAEPRRLPSILERVALAAQQTSATVRVVGGAGLALLLGHRRSDDLDLFCARGEDIEPVVRSVEAAVRICSALPRRVRSGPGFVRIEIAAGPASQRVDVVEDAAPHTLADPILVGSLRVESLRDQRANKLASVLGRSELRDLVDLWFIEQAGLPAIEGLEDAATKDAGMDPAWLAWAVAQIEIRPLPGMVARLDESALGRFRESLVSAALDLAGASRSS